MNSTLVVIKTPTGRRIRQKKFFFRDLITITKWTVKLVSFLFSYFITLSLLSFSCMRCCAEKKESEKTIRGKNI